MSKEYLDKAGLTYLWSKLKAYFQVKLVSGTNIKTVNNNSLLGSGDISIKGDVTGVKGAAESSYRTGNVNLTAANIGAAASSHTHDANSITSVRESEITWGNKDFSANYSVGDVFLNDALRANRFAGLRAEGITVEYSRDNGSTWSEYETTDLDKRNLFTINGNYLISGSASRTATTSDQLRITVDTGLGGIYSYLNKFHIYISTNGSSGCTVSIDAAPSNDINNFNKTICTDVPIAGWSGWNVIHIPFSFCTAYTSQSSSSNYRKIRFLFKHTGINTTYKGLSVQRIFAFGGVGYNTPSTLALNGHVYTFNGNLDVTFPGTITASQFVGNATTASLAVKTRALEGVDTRNTNQPPSWYISNYPYRMVKEFKSTSAIGVADILSSWVYCELITDVYYADWSGGEPFQIAINKTTRAIRFATNSSTWGDWQDLSNASTVNGHTVNTDVPSGAKFTDTVTTATTTGSGNAVTAITATNGALSVTKGTTFLTSHQDISGKADKSATVSTVTWDSTNKKLTKTINGTTTDIVTAANLRTGLNVADGAEVNQNAFSNVKVGSTTVAADTKTDTLELVAGSNVTITPDATNDKITIAATDTTYESKAAASGGTAVSLVTTGEKYTWNNKSTVPTNHASSATTYGTGTSSNYGHLKLSDSTSSTSGTSGGIAATPSAVKSAYDLANTANTTANTALSGVNGNLIYDHTFTISNGVATFTPHVYQKGEEVTSNYAASCFTWKYRLINGSEVSLTTKSDRGCDVTISNLGYGGHVIGAFTPPE